MRNRALTVGLAIVLLATACGGSTSPSVGAVYNVTFHQDSSQVYGSVSGCVMYCMVWDRVSADVTGAIDMNASTATMDSVVFGGGGPVHLDSLPNPLEATKNWPTCGNVSFRATVSDGVVRGTWTQMLDCHGRSRVGTLHSR